MAYISRIPLEIMLLLREELRIEESVRRSAEVEG
jgi:hypothetical protein